MAVMKRNGWLLAVLCVMGVGFLLACCGAQAAPPKNIALTTGVPARIDMKTWYLSDGWVNGDHQACEWRADAVRPKGGTVTLLLSGKGGRLRPVGCPEMQSHARYSYGRFEARLRTAAGSGLNTAFFTFIGPPNGVPEHDEIDFEFLGKDPRTVQVTHYVAGKKQAEVMVPLGFDASKAFHDYAFEWTPTSIRWFVDGKKVHETAADASIPRNPGKIFLSLWAGTSMVNGWMGPFTYTAPVSAEVDWVRYTALSPQGAR